MRSFLVAIAALVVVATTPAQAAQPNVAITVDKNTQTMTVAVDGVERYRWPVSTGIPSRETPNGAFRAFRMEEDHYSKEFDDAPMPHSIFFTKIGHAIHGTQSENRLGTPASHGCVRLSQANAATLYALVEKEGVLNTTVTLTGSAQIALARNPRRITTAVAGHDLPQAGDDQQQQYSAAGEPVDITPQQQPMMQGGMMQGGMQAGMAPPQPDSRYIYPADGSSDQQIYPAPPSATRRTYGAQAYPQPQPQPQQAYPQPQQRQYYSYDNPQYVPPPPGYYQPRQVYPPRGYYQN